MLRVQCWQLVALAMLLAVSSTSEAHIHITGLTLQLNNVPYYVPPQSIGVISQPANNSKARDFDLVPITVVTSNYGKFGQDELENITTEFSGIDDVFQDGFLQGAPTICKTKKKERKKAQTKKKPG